MPNLRNELQELVDRPNETLEVEYKEWLDLVDDAEARADLARHLAAMANYGGGTIVIRITDDMKFAGTNRFPTVHYDRDLVSGIVKRYLDPTFQCDVQIVRSVEGNEHPVIIVPPHGATPICARADGPHVNGRPKGILKGVHYTRKPGPESAPIQTAAEWAPIIRRSAMHERAAILGAIDLALRGATQSGAATDTLKTWHDSAHAAFLKDVEQKGLADRLGKNHVQLSYLIERADNQKLDPGRLTQILREINAEVRDLVNTGWSMFYLFVGSDIAPRFATDPSAGVGDDDFLEVALLRSKERTFAPDMWRVSADGKATIIRQYWEDDPEFSQTISAIPGRWFSPNWMVQSLAEIVRHARGMAERFDASTAINFRCEWHGLANRSFQDVLAIWSSWTSHTDHRISAGTWPFASVVDNWPDPVARLGGPVIRLFTTEFSLSPEWVRSQSKRWVK